MRRRMVGVRVLALGLCLTGAGLWANPAKADTLLYNNLSNAPSTVLSTYPIGTFPPSCVGCASGPGPEGDSFSTGSTPFLLTNVTLALQGVTDGESFNVSLYSDNNTTCTPTPVCAGGPQTLLNTIAAVSDNSLSTSLTDVEFSLALPQTLAANTTYWIIASSTDESGTLWSYTEDLSGTGVAGEFNLAYGGVLPNISNVTDPGCGSPNVCTPFQMEVAGTALPEPSSVSMLGIGLGLVGLVGVMRRSIARGFPQAT